MRILPVILAGLLATGTLTAQKDDSYYSARALRNQNKIYNPDLYTVLLHPLGNPLGTPVIALGSRQKLSLGFDDLAGGYKTYYYTFIHCDASWNPSPLRPNEYIQGFGHDEIRDYAYSFNTTMAYTHYSVDFPGPDMQLTKSGNYLLVVYQDDVQRPDFSMRFMVYENLVKIDNIRSGRASLPNAMNSSQEVDFKLRPGRYNIPAPSRDLKVVIRQNGRWDNAVTLTQPRNITPDELDYDYEEGNLFDAGNQYRQIDIKSLRYRSERIADIQYHSDGYHVFVRPDLPRAGRPYISEPDINGRMLIKTEDMERSETEADYAWVHFSLPFGYPLAQGSFFITGSLTYNTLQPNAKLSYNYESKQYEATLLLKQGYYNYLYVAAGSESNVGETALAEGNHYEAENHYSIWVYHREPGDIYDKLIAIYLQGE